MTSYLPLLLLFVIAAVLAVALFTITTLLGPKNPTPEKQMPFECGSDSTGSQFVRPSVKFYLTAILFVVFDIEAVFLYPWAARFREFGLFGLIEMVLFLVVLGLTLVYAWRKGALEWER